MTGDSKLTKNHEMDNLLLVIFGKMSKKISLQQHAEKWSFCYDQEHNIYEKKVECLLSASRYK